jgi:gamma-glutamyltranspeptidase/glutathione hydrolase
MEFISRRSAIYAKHGVAAASQPLVVNIGLNMLQQGGNAVDAAIAMAAALNVTEPTSCGIGGDMFALFYGNTTKKTIGINGSGRAPKDLTLEKIREEGINTPALPSDSIHTVTVPGAVAGFIDLLEKYGTMDRKEVLQPAIDLAQEGFPVAPITSFFWRRGKKKLLQGPHGNEMLINGEGPHSGQIMKNPTLARTFEEIVDHGKDGFYKGRVAEEIVSLIRSRGGYLALEDLERHKSEWVNPISVDYKGITVSEIPPNGQGITALLALNIIEEFDFDSIKHFSSDYFHLLIESMRIAFADSRWYVSDPEFNDIPIKELLSKSYASTRRKLIDRKKATLDVKHGSPFSSSDTVYFTVADKEGNACSFIYSNYEGFGTGLIPKGCGFTLQNRGANFSLLDGHPNVLEPNKRPYHTIIPGMATQTDSKELYCSFGVMGGFMQPQGHVQVLLNMIEYGMNPQEALDSPRFCIASGESGGDVYIEDQVPQGIISSLSNKGHTMIPRSGIQRSIFGRGQIIKKIHEYGVYVAGSDPRADGLALGY